MFTLIGILLAISTALDFALKPRFKIIFAEALGNHTRPKTFKDPNSRIFIEGIFGRSLFSARAILVSILLSILSLVITYLYAVFTSNFDLIWIFESRPSASAISMFCFFLFGSILGDILSFAQTRLFLRAVDQYKSSAVRVGLALADAVISLSLFVIIFSTTRLLAYLLIIGSSPNANLDSVQFINLDALEQIVPSLVKYGIAKKEEVEWIDFIARTRSKQDASIVDESLRSYSEKVLGINRQDNDFTFDAKFICSPASGLAITQRDTIGLLTKTIAGQRGYQTFDTQYANIREAILSRYKPEFPDDAKCPIRVLTIKRTMNAGRLISVAGPVNTWWAALERTLFNTYQAVGYKFGPYLSIDPFMDIPDFYSSVVDQSGYSLFDLTYADPTIPYLLSEFTYKVPEGTESVQIPYSPMLGSCLAVSFMFWMFIAWKFLSKWAAAVLYKLSRISNKFDFTKGPFTVMALVISFSIITIRLIAFILDFGWRLLF